MEGWGEFWEINELHLEYDKISNGFGSYIASHIYGASVSSAWKYRKLVFIDRT